MFIYVYLWRYERGDDGMLRDSREDSLVDTYKTTPPMSHTESPRGKIILYSVFYYIFVNIFANIYAYDKSYILMFLLLYLQEA